MNSGVRAEIYERGDVQYINKIYTRRKVVICVKVNIDTRINIAMGPTKPLHVDK